ncbi:MAG: fasciclin domain-containing protein, partial [Bacilli bacterium]|nr:fasciclin domain-containing protein [Bacilli bacterium]
MKTIRKIAIILSLIVGLGSLNSCIDENFSFQELFGTDKEHGVPEFKDVVKFTITDWVQADSLQKFSKFMKLLEVGKLDKTLSAYNPNAYNYTLFLPTDDAIDEFIANSNLFSSFDEMLADVDYVSTYVRYHVVDQGVESSDFPFGAFSELNLTGQYLTVGFISEADSSYFIINNEAPIWKKDIEATNGFIHVVSKSLVPITFSTYEWLAQNSEFSIFKAAVDKTGFKELLNQRFDQESENPQLMTLLLEPDSVYKKQGIHSVDDLIAKVSPNNSNYTSDNNPLYNFVGYHILQNSYFIANLEEPNEASNYNTYSDVPVNIDGSEKELMINQYKNDTIVVNGEQRILTYITINYDKSNILTLTGAIHMLSNVLYQKQPTVSDQSFQFYEETVINEASKEPGSYLFEDDSEFNYITFKGSELYYYKSGDEAEDAWSDDYIYMYGDIEFNYTVPKIIQGEYMLGLEVNRIYSNNALIEVYVDGVK